MDLHLAASRVNSASEIKIGGSKSETNRLLLLQALYPEIGLENTSEADDSEVMRQAIQGNDSLIDIHHAGTAMRFLTAYFAMQPNREVVLTGSDRMKERPIQILVDALRHLGAAIEYAEKEGFPPLRIKGSKLLGGNISLAADVSSQFITALLLIAPKLGNGLQLTLNGRITSMPYILMTLGLLRQIGVQTEFVGNTITVPNRSVLAPVALAVESDWSSASYFYSIVALSEIGTTIALSHFGENSLQGDRALAEIYQNFGVGTTFDSNKIMLQKTAHPVSGHLLLDLNETPDIAQTIAVTCFGLGIGCELTGLHTLKIKETDRLTALQNELTKLGATVSVTRDRLTLEASTAIRPDVKIETYNDHRMAMAFAPLALKVPIVIQYAEVVSKSYPNFWNDLESIGFKISQGE
ncbi:3-phosphoshikimate 1-carboxyvinyltransferase [Flavobacterium sp.]|uniref:3-phosphoshikimate 1-carboxyvinyltransferase n=1 Tax=Flavobacterium sp. TaxID=239 RepID=UPI0039E64EDE